jgi:hypothetical protein
MAEGIGTRSDARSDLNGFLVIDGPNIGWLLGDFPAMKRSPLAPIQIGKVANA